MLNRLHGGRTGGHVWLFTPLIIREIMETRKIIGWEKVKKSHSSICNVLCVQKMYDDDLNSSSFLLDHKNASANQINTHTWRHLADLRQSSDTASMRWRLRDGIIFRVSSFPKDRTLPWHRYDSSPLDIYTSSIHNLSFYIMQMLQHENYLICVYIYTSLPPKGIIL